MTMTYKNYLIEENEHYHVAHPESKYILVVLQTVMNRWVAAEVLESVLNKLTNV